MKLLQVFVILFLQGISTVQPQNEAKLAQCGGEVTSDSDSLMYPAPGDLLVPGEICVWTIHLQTTRNFRFEFQDLSIGSNYTDCRDGGLRLYSLSNLIPQGEMEGYTFCDQKPSGDIFHLTNNIAVIILYVGVGNTDPGRGFNLTWTGSNTDPLRTQHISAFSTASQGVIKYPVRDTYEPSLAATWLIKTVTPQQTTRSDFSLNNIDLEPCSLPSNPCSCDALILYEVNMDGFLNETQRFCGEEDSAEIKNIESRFIVAFFSDFETADGGGSGFEVVYYPTDELPPTTMSTTTTTTTTEATTTFIPSTEGPIEETPCGSIFTNITRGHISYKSGETYNPGERCVWTIRIPRAIGMTFRLVQSGISSDPNDGISISTFTRADPPLQRTEFLREEGVVTTLYGSVAIVTFVSDAEDQGQGFLLEYQVNGFTNPSISPFSTDFISKNPVGSLEYPVEGCYDNNELATFVITTPDFSVDGGARMNVTWTLKFLESSCYDYVVVYKFYPEPNSFGGWSQYDLYCATSPKFISHFDMLLYVFKSDSSIIGDGFKLDWAGA